MIRVPFGSGIAGKVAESGTSLNIPDAYACGLFNPAIDKKTGFRTRNILCCPISDMAGNHVAVIQVIHSALVIMHGMFHDNSVLHNAEALRCTYASKLIVQDHVMCSA